MGLCIAYFVLRKHSCLVGCRMRFGSDEKAQYPQESPPHPYPQYTRNVSIVTTYEIRNTEYEMPIIPDSPLSVYESHFREGIVFVTLTGVRGEKVFGRAETANLLRSVLREVRQEAPFSMQAWVILPNQARLLFHPTGASGADEIVRRVRHRYTRDYAQLLGSPSEVVVWDSRFGLEGVADVAEFARQMDAIHYAPVQNGLVKHPEDWSQSSYAAWAERGLYKLGWGWSLPDRLEGK